MDGEGSVELVVLEFGFGREIRLRLVGARCWQLSHDRQGVASFSLDHKQGIVPSISLVLLTITSINYFPHPCAGDIVGKACVHATLWTAMMAV